MPFHMTDEQLVVQSSYSFNEELTLHIRQCIRIAFLQKKSLFEVSSRVIRQMREKDGGQWLCYIQPLDIEIGLASQPSNRSKRIYFTFSRGNLEYQIKIAQTRPKDDITRGSTLQTPGGSILQTHRGSILQTPKVSINLQT